jgi:DNA-binding NarL/FixJ family response regulator
MDSLIVIASTSVAIVEKSIRKVCSQIAIKRALDEADLNCLIDQFEPGHIFLESNFCQIAMSYLMAKKLSDHAKLRFVIFSFDVLSTQETGRFYNLGAVGFLNFRSPVEDCRRGIAELLKGNEYIPKEAEKFLKDFRIGKLQRIAFTVREIQVLRHTAKGKSLGEIAEILSLTFRSAQNIKTRVCQKAGVKNSVQIMLFALSMGYVTLNELTGNKIIGKE